MSDTRLNPCILLIGPVFTWQFLPGQHPSNSDLTACERTLGRSIHFAAQMEP